jgi:hypothetical protein
MIQSAYETVLFALVSMNAAVLLFIAGVVRKTMNDLDGPAFQQFVGSLARHSSKSPFMITILNIPAIVAIPYCYRYGLGNRWIVSGLAVWLIAGLLAKAFKLPIYRALVVMKSHQVTQRDIARKKLNAGNLFQAVMYAVATCLMTVNFI